MGRPSQLATICPTMRWSIQRLRTMNVLNVAVNLERSRFCIITKKLTTRKNVHSVTNYSRVSSYTLDTCKNTICLIMSCQHIWPYPILNKIYSFLPEPRKAVPSPLDTSGICQTAHAAGGWSPRWSRAGCPREPRSPGLVWRINFCNK